jgi:hypothetical protein
MSDQPLEATPGPLPAVAVAASPRRRPRPELWLALGLVVADQLSKAAIRATIPLYD